MSGVVAVTAPRRTDLGRERVALNSSYVRVLVAAGLVPLVVPPLLDPAAAGPVLDAVTGLLLTGGEDVHPQRYGTAAHPRLGETDQARDALEIALVHAARARRLPVLAVCRGIQLVNVALGGSLYQDLPSERPSAIDHADPQGRHPVRIERDSLLHRVVGDPASVNSRHHQAVHRLAPGLRATAWAEDGVIEAVEPTDPGAEWLLGVQWHPEDDVETALFAGFARATTERTTAFAASGRR